MNTISHPNTLEDFLKFAYNVETEGDTKLLAGDSSYQEQTNAIMLPNGIFETLVKDFECYRTEAEEALKKYDQTTDGEFVTYVQQALNFIPMALWSEAGMLITPFTVKEKAFVVEIAMEPKPTLENKAKVVSLCAERFKQIDAKNKEENDHIEEALKNPVVVLSGNQGYFIVEEDGKKASIVDLDGTPKAVGFDISPAEYMLCLAASDLERRILHLREKYEPETIDWTKEPSFGVSTHGYDGDGVKRFDTEITKYEEWRKEFDVTFLYDLVKENVEGEGELATPVVEFEVEYEEGKAILKTEGCPVVIAFDYEYDITDSMQLHCLIQVKLKQVENHGWNMIHWHMKDNKQRLRFIIDLLSTDKVEEAMNVIDEYARLVSD